VPNGAAIRGGTTAEAERLCEQKCARRLAIRAGDAGNRERLGRRAEEAIRNRADVPAQLRHAREEDFGVELRRSLRACVSRLVQHSARAVRDRLRRELETVVRTAAAREEQATLGDGAAVDRHVGDEHVRRRIDDARCQFRQ